MASLSADMEHEITEADKASGWILEFFHCDLTQIGLQAPDVLPTRDQNAAMTNDYLLSTLRLMC